MPRSEAPIILAVDPGGRYTGIVARKGDTLLGHSLVERKGGMVEYIDTVLFNIYEIIVSLPHGYTAIGVEMIQPMPNIGSINPSGSFDACRIEGAVLATYHDVAVMVPPGKHGQKRPLDEHYPADLIGPREVKGEGILNHCRAAWDQAAATLELL